MMHLSADWSISDRFMFFFKQTTAYGKRISDWSSDVCSSDLPGRRSRRRWLCPYLRRVAWPGDRRRARRNQRPHLLPPLRSGTDRKSAVLGKSVLVRVDLGGRCFIQTKRNLLTMESGHRVYIHVSIIILYRLTTNSHRH